METYLIFFGKSQDFTFYAFDKSKEIENFDKVIKDFEELESKVFTTDDIGNKQILAKYVFNENGRKFSLLKLYSLAQAYNGNRIDGSTYGVALLSTNDIAIEENNIEILNTVKSNFANLTLSGLKFKKSDFFKEAKLIWEALVNHHNGNYLEKISYNNSFPEELNNKVNAFWVKDLSHQPVELNNHIIRISRLYFSEDLEHLKRTQERRGKEVFPIYYKDNNSYILFREKPEGRKIHKTEADGTTNLKIEIGNLKRELSESRSSFSKLKRKSGKKIKFLTIVSIISLLTAITFFFKDSFFSSHNVSENQQLDSETGKIDNREINSQIGLIDILNDRNKLDTLQTLITNIQLYQDKENKDKYLDAIERDTKSLNIKIEDLKFIQETDTLNIKDEDLGDTGSIKTDNKTIMTSDTTSSNSIDSTNLTPLVNDSIIKETEEPDTTKNQ